MEKFTCMWCEGTGVRNKRQCSACEGAGSHTIERALRLMVNLVGAMARRIGDLEVAVGRLAETQEDATQGGRRASDGPRGQSLEEWARGGSSRRHGMTRF